VVTERTEPIDPRLPRVSVIVPVFNVADTLPVTLPSWLGQDHPAEWILVDDGSTDGSLDMMESLTRGAESFRVLSHERNRGRAAARNTGIAAAVGDVLLFLDADMRPEPDFVRQHALLHRDPEVIGVVSRPVLEDLDLTDPYHRYLQSRCGAASVGEGRPLPFKYFIIGYTSVKADAVRAVGGFDERLTYGEDIDFAYRLVQRHPTGLRYSSKPTVHHYGHGTLEERIEKLREFGRANLPLLLTKHPSMAHEANVDFVDSPHFTPSLTGRLKRWVLRPRIASVLRRLLPYAPRGMSDLLVRYLMAAAIADAYAAPAPSPR
jgi:glycosyltransferase involved in cell wall biosynthesis